MTALDIPPIGDEFDGRIVVASGWVDDSTESTRIGLLLLDPGTPGKHYEVAEYRVAGDRWEQTWGEVHANIIPAARLFEAAFDFWGEA